MKNTPIQRNMLPLIFTDEGKLMKSVQPLSPENHPHTGIIDAGKNGFTHKSKDPSWIRWAYSPNKGNTVWFKTYVAAKRLFTSQEPK
jgi:hypothetical protein